MKIDIWEWFDRELKVHCDHKEHYDKILRWKGCKEGGIYYYPDGTIEYDVIIPRKYEARVRNLLQSLIKSKTSKSGEISAKVVLNDNDLQEEKLPSRA